MSSPQLPNHLRAHRKRAGLSQVDVACLVGSSSAAKVSRYESFDREPPGLRTILAYEVIFQKAGRELFPGLYAKIEREVASRAASMLANRDNRAPRLRIEWKLKVLADIAAPQSRKAD